MGREPAALSSGDGERKDSGGCITAFPFPFPFPFDELAAEIDTEAEAETLVAEDPSLR